MIDAARRRMQADEFLTWCLDQPYTYELIRGAPVLKFDNGATIRPGRDDRSDRVVVNLISRLRNALRGEPCRPVTAAQASLMSNGDLRRPDVTIDCGDAADDDLATAHPTVFFEVLSPSTRRLDLIRKADEYRQLPSLRHFVLIEPGVPLALLWTRSADGDWTERQVEGLNAVLDLTALNLTLPMAEVYEDLRFE